jgi:hypothetical protein
MLPKPDSLHREVVWRESDRNVSTSSLAFWRKLALRLSVHSRNQSIKAGQGRWQQPWLRKK